MHANPVNTLALANHPPQKKTANLKSADFRLLPLIPQAPALVESEALPIVFDFKHFFCVHAAPTYWFFGTESTLVWLAGGQ